MKGLRLFVRPIEPADAQMVGLFLERNRETAPSASVPAWGLLGKLLGDIVAVISLTDQGEELRIDEIVVSRDLRKKRIGRVMIAEAAALAAKLEAGRLVAVDEATPRFWQRVGFESEGGRWVLRIPESSARR